MKLGRLSAKIISDSKSNVMSRVDQERSRSRSGSARSLQLGRASKEISLLEEAAYFQNPVLSLCIVMYCTVYYCTVL